MIVEDEKNIRELLKDILLPYYQVREAADGEEALKEIEQKQPDIIISDTAPIMIGRTARHIQSYQKKPYSRSSRSVFSVYLSCFGRLRAAFLCG